MSVAAELERVPIRRAATLMLVDDRPDLQVLMLRRRQGSNFVGGMSVFPGGGVDEEDGAPAVEAMADGLDADQANRRLELTGGALAHWMAAIRETFEEAGVLLARAPGEPHPIALDAAEIGSRFARHREQVDTGRVLLADVLKQEGLRLATDLIHYSARWITPPGPPRRYDTRFFIAAAPAAQDASADETEAVHSEWMGPAAALERFAAGELLLMPPTVGMLRILSGFASAAEAVASARLQQDTPDRIARVGGRGGGWRVLLPGDADYEGGEDDGSLAWVRLASPSLLRSSIQGPSGDD